jgi:hypothetical protein
MRRSPGSPRRICARRCERRARWHKFPALVNDFGRFVKQPFSAPRGLGNVSRMTTNLSARVIATGVVALAAALAWAAPPDKPYFPEGYRDWRVAKFKLIGPDSPNYEKQGGFRHHFANDIAFASWGQFKEGAVIVDERVHAKLDDGGVWQDAGLAHVAVMRKDPAHFADTGGWYFNFFREADTTAGLTPAQAKSACFDACHKNVATRDFVFSDPRR